MYQEYRTIYGYCREGTGQFDGIEGQKSTKADGNVMLGGRKVQVPSWVRSSSSLDFQIGVAIS